MATAAGNILNYVRRGWLHVTGGRRVKGGVVVGAVLNGASRVWFSVASCGWVVGGRRRVGGATADTPTTSHHRSEPRKANCI